MRLLLVEDESILAFHAAWVIENELNGAVIEIASSVDEALSVIGTEDLAGAILDAHLHGQSAASIAEALRQRNVPFFVVSGTIVPELLPAQLNGVPVLQKPYQDEDLVAHVLNLSNCAAAGQ